MVIAHRHVVVAAITIFLVIIVLLFFFVTKEAGRTASSISNPDAMYNVSRISLTDGNETSFYYVYVANNAEEQQYGYMYANSIGDCKGNSPCLGMLFVYSSESNLCFWMDNTRIPLKQIWFDENGSATYFYDGVPYSLTTVCHNAKMVLETYPNQSVENGTVLAFVH